MSRIRKKPSKSAESDAEKSIEGGEGYYLYSSDEEFNKDSENYVAWQDIFDVLEKGDLILCELKTMIDEHIAASFLDWEKITQTRWYCVQVVKTETISEAKRCLLLEIKNDKGEFVVKYFVAHELGDVYHVEDHELTRKSKTKLSKVKFVGAELNLDEEAKV